MNSIPFKLHPLVIAIIVWRHDSMAAPSPLPSLCSYDVTLVTCSDSHRLNLQGLAAAVMMDYVVTFVYLKSSKSLCTCKIVHFIKLLKNMDIFVMTTSRCTLNTLRNCGVEIPLSDPVLVAGLVVSRENPKLRWGVKHYLIETCDKIEDLPDAGVRTVLYRSFVKELGEEEARLEKLAISKGDIMFYHKVQTDMVTTTTAATATNSEVPTSEPLKKSIASLMAGYLKRVNSAAVAVERAQHDIELPYTVRPSESELQNALTGELKDIKTNLKHHGKRQALALADLFPDAHVKGNRSLVADSYSFSDGSTLMKMNNQPGLMGYLVRKAALRLRRSTAHVRPSLLPQKVFVDGEYVSIFDSNTILEDLELEAPLPTLTNPFTTLRKTPAPSTASPKEDHRNPVGNMLFPSQDEAMSRALSRGMIDLKDDDVDDDLDDEDPNMVDTMDPAGEALMNAKMKLKTITKVPRVTVLPPVSVKSLKELQSEHRESDHRIKSFVIFFIAVLGIIGVIAVLLVLAIKKRPSKDKFTVFDVPKKLCEYERRERVEQLLKQHEALMSKKRRINPVYSDVESYEQATPFIDPLSGRRIATSRTTQTGIGFVDGFLEDGGFNVDVATETPILKKHKSTLGGRHVFSEFEKQSGDSFQDKTFQESDWMNDDNLQADTLLQQDDERDYRSQGGRKKVVGFNFNQSSSENGGPKLVSFLESLTTSKDGVIRSDHREQLNVKEYIQQQHSHRKQEQNAPESRKPSRVKRVTKRNPGQSFLEPSLKLHTARITQTGADVKVLPVKVKSLC